MERTLVSLDMCPLQVDELITAGRGQYYHGTEPLQIDELIVA